MLENCIVALLMCLRAIFVSCQPKHGPKCRVNYVVHCAKILARHDMTHTVSYQHGPKYFMPCLALGLAKGRAMAPF